MLVQLTTFGVNLMKTATSPVILSSFQIGSAFNYVPDPNQNAIQGTLLYSGVPTMPRIEADNFLQYTVDLPVSVGTFDFGEIALFYGSQLFAICVLDVLMHKQPLNPNTNVGGEIIINFNVPSIGENYQMWANITQSNTNKVSALAGPEELPQAYGASPNIYVIGTIDGTKPYLAYTDRNGVWSFDTYSDIGALQVTSTDTSGNATSIKVNQTAFNALDIESGEGIICQFVSGSSFASVRYVVSQLSDGQGNLVLGFNAPIFTSITTGDSLEFYVLGAPSATTVNISSLLSFKDVNGNYTLQLGDEKAVCIRQNSAAPAAITIPTNASQAFPIGSNMLVGWYGTGQVQIIPENGTVTIRTPSTNFIAQRYGKIALLKEDTNTWSLEGNLYQGA